MKRYYAHYTFIYPDIFLKNHIVEIADEGAIAGYYLFERELSHTEYHSGIQVFLPQSLLNNIEIEDLINSYTELKDFTSEDCLIRSFEV